MKIKFKLTLIILVFFCLCGCAAAEPESRFTVTSLAFLQRKDTSCVYLQAVDPENGAFTLEGEGESFEAALRDIGTKLTKSPSFSHCETLIFSFGAEGEKLDEIFSLCDKKEVPLRANILFSENPEKLLKDKDGTDGYDLVSLADQTVKNFGFGGHTAIFEIKTAILTNRGDFAVLNIETEKNTRVTGLRRYRQGMPAELLDINQSVNYAKQNNTYEGSNEN